MNYDTYRIPRHPVWPTILILIVGATLGVVATVVLSFFAAQTVVVMMGPLAWFFYGATVLAIYSKAMVVAVVGTPLWALVGGAFFAMFSSGNGGSAAQQMGVTFFSDTHPVAQAARSMTDRLGIPPVRYVGWYAADDINAFAMGTEQDNALIALSRGAVDKLTRSQLDAVIGHELGHVASDDMVRMTYALGVRDSLTFFLIFRGLKKVACWVFTPFSELELLRFSRQREFTADAVAARLTSPEDMIAVLTLLQREEREPVTKDLATVMMSARFNGTWFSTHPPLEDRIRSLEALRSATRLNL